MTTDILYALMKLLYIKFQLNCVLFLLHTLNNAATLWLRRKLIQTGQQKFNVNESACSIFSRVKNVAISKKLCKQVLNTSVDKVKASGFVGTTNRSF